MNIPAKLVPTTRGKEKLVDDEGFVYNFEKHSRDGKLKFWVCEKRFSVHKCSARAHTLGSAIVHKGGRHAQHTVQAEQVELRSIYASAKARAVQSTEPSGNVAIAAMTSASLSAQAASSCGLIERVVRSTRQKVLAAPVAPRRLEDIALTDNVRTYQPAQGGPPQPFVLYDSGFGDPHRIIIMGSARGVEHLGMCSDWFCDGTFDVAPELFCQLYCVSGLRLGSCLPLLYALLPGKAEDVYVRLFTAVRGLLPYGKLPTSCMMDFETAAHKAWKTCFPLAALSGCLFHHGQCIWRKIQACGLQQTYQSDASFALACRKLMAIAFVPLGDAARAFEELTDPLTGTLPDALVPVADYYEDTWIGRPTANGGRRAPLYEHGLWGQYDRVLGGHSRTNNSTEASHQALQVMLGLKHPTTFRLIGELKKQQQKIERRMEAMVAGNEPPRPRKKYRGATANLERIVGSYAMRTMEEYLRGVAHNLGY